MCCRGSFPCKYLAASSAHLLKCCIQAGAALKEEGTLDVDEIINGLRAYVDSTHDAKTLVQTVVQLHSSSPTLEHADEVCGDYYEILPQILTWF